jgi:hypothetical protein
MIHNLLYGIAQEVSDLELRHDAKFGENTVQS